VAGEDEMKIPAGGYENHEKSPLVGAADRPDRVAASDDRRAHRREEEVPRDSSACYEVIVGGMYLAALEDALDEDECDVNCYNQPL